MKQAIHETFLTRVREIQSAHGASGRERDLAAHYLVGAMAVYLSSRAANNVLACFENYHQAGKHRET